MVQKPPIELASNHAHQLFVESGIAPDIVHERGYRTVTSKAEMKRLGFGAAQQNVPALIAPIYNVHGEIALYQARPDEPRIKNGKPLKYEFPGGAAMTIDVHPSIRHQLNDPSIPLYITEGTKKADCAISHRLCCIALLGVWNWRGTNSHGGKTALPDWDHIALNGRRCYIVFDSDVMVKHAVHAALARLKALLDSRGATS